MQSSNFLKMVYTLQCFIFTPLPNLKFRDQVGLTHTCRSSNQKCSIKNVFLNNFAKFKGKHLCQSLFLSTVAYNFIKKESLVQMFSCEFYEIFKNIFFTEHIWTSASAHSKKATITTPSGDASVS